MTHEDRVALITGSTGEGMGRSIALTLAHRGVDVVLNYGTHRRGPEAAEAANRVKGAIQEMGRRVIVYQADTRDANQVEAMVERAIDELGHVEILLNNAGGGWHMGDYADIEPEQWRDVLAAEIDGAFWTMKYCLPGMRERGRGRIVHIALSGTPSTESVAWLSADYALGKAVRAWMTNAFGLGEFGKGITVNCIEPCPTAHMSFEDALAAARGDGDAWRARTAPQAHDIAEIVAFLCSEAGRFISGSHIRLPMKRGT